jgi:hypothetical protein
MTTTPNVRPGQVWADNDPRGYGRQVRVIDVDHRYAYVRGHDSRGGWNGRPSRISLSSLRPDSKGQRTGYHLVRDVAEEVTP